MFVSAGHGVSNLFPLITMRTRNFFLLFLSINGFTASADHDWIRQLQNPFFSPPPSPPKQTEKSLDHLTPQHRWGEDIASQVQAVAISNSTAMMLWNRKFLRPGDSISLLDQTNEIQFELIAIDRSSITLRLVTPAQEPLEYQAFKVEIDPFFSQ